ncbi:MAG TPA: type II toxin-antitoxin system VapC family toxin [Campylobacterales bacterium]|nr:type II toxin-antitoxin system VapC family toxin [Campylobacterales bacterium]
MNGRALLDSNVIIDIAKERLDISKINDYSAYAISVITYMETLGYRFGDTNEKIKIKAILSCFDIVQLDGQIVETVVKIRQNNKIKLPDAIIAATALEHNMVLITNNTKDFENIITSIVSPYFL